MKSGIFWHTVNMNKKNDQQISTVLEFLYTFPNMYKSKKRKDIPDPSTENGKYQIKKIMEDAFSKKIIPSAPETIPDPVVSSILEVSYGIKHEKLSDIAKEHQLSMGAENVVGALLENYINSESNKYEWCMCAGEVVHGTDFIRKMDENNTWELLQVKNRDNSENSSSSTVRELIKQNSGIVIKKWYRTKSRTGKTNWENFPDENLKNILNEFSFQNYVKEYLSNI
jgi:hypothetical protein